MHAGPHVILPFLILPFLCQANLDFAIYKGEIYASALNESNECLDRGHHTLYGLYQLSRKFHLPDRHGNIASIGGDDIGGTEFGNSLAFWHRPGSTLPFLWPDHDFFGSFAGWVPPHETMVAVLEAEMLAWKSRDSHVFFSGSRKSRNKVSFSDPLGNGKGWLGLLQGRWQNKIHPR